MKLRFTLQQLSLSRWLYHLLIASPIVLPIYLVVYYENSTFSIGPAEAMAQALLLLCSLLFFCFLLWTFIYLLVYYPLRKISLTALFPPHFIILKAVLSAFFVFILYFFAKYSLLLVRQEGLDWWQYLSIWLIMWTLLIEAYLYLNGLSALMLNKPKGFSWIKHVGVLVLFFVILPMASTTVVLVVWSKFF